MKSTALSLRSMQVALALVLLAGCHAAGDDTGNSVPPSPTVVLQGTVTGLGTRRPLVLQYNGTDVCIDPAAPAGPRIECSFYGVLNQTTSAFSFGALPVGTAYNITVKSQPYGKLCTVSGGVGTLGTAVTSIGVACSNDPAVPRYSVSGTVDAAVAFIPGARVVLTTEEGVREQLLNGATTFLFERAVFDSGTSLPVFAWSVGADFAGSDGRVNRCTVANGTNVGTDGNATAAPADPVTNVQVLACRFAVSVTVAYSGAPSQSLGAGGVTLELRDPRTGIAAVVRNPATGKDETVPALNIASAGTASFARQLLSNTVAVYDLVITAHPAGQTCVVGSSAQLRQGSAVLLLNPADTTHGFFTAKNVRCRATPPEGALLRGTYQQTSVIDGASTNSRNFLTFFDDGTFLYGLHATGANCSANCGVEHGFYSYDATAGTIAFTPLTDTVAGSNANRLSTGGATATLTNVVISGTEPSQISAAFGAGTSWLLTAQTQIPGQMTGTWATADHRRVWVYNAGRYTGFHAGVNGLGNVQDACFTIEDPASPVGFLSRRGNGTTCQLGSGAPGATSLFTLDVPNSATTPRVPEGYVGKWPQSGSNADGRPSAPVLYTIEPGAPDRLTVQNTLLDGTPVDPPILLLRETVP